MPRLLALVSCVFALEALSKPCEPLPMPSPDLLVQDGFVEFLSKSVIQPLKDALPQVSDQEVDAILRAPETMWYDENSMVFLYQDSIEVVTGARANCVGRKIGEDNPGTPGIFKLTNYFGPDYRFLFPFRTAAGTDNVTNVKVINFWSPPRRNSKPLPVKYWRPTSRGRWYWTFPVGTVFGEVLYEKSPNGRWYVFEVRTRKRYLDGWNVDLFRPFPTSDSLVRAVTQLQPDWEMSTNLRQLVRHLENKDTLVSNRWTSPAYGKVFPSIDGALDRLPEIEDKALVTRLLTEVPFVSTEGTIWKENGRLETYAPASESDFHVVPKGYEMGMIPVNEVSCNRCHSETGRRLYHFDFDIQLYGEVWGEDRIFTWHLFEPTQYIFGPWDDTQGSRKPNSRMTKANLIKNEKPAGGDIDYKPLPGVFVPESRTHH